MKFEKNPDKQYRALPFWSLNGKLNAEELRAQIKIIKDMGFGGAFIHSRTGLATEYMSDEWLNLVKMCGDEFARLGMDAWLYDEDRWPSGTCGGYVTEDPRYRSKFLSAHIVEKSEADFGKYGAEFVAAFAIKLTGEEYSEAKEGMPKYSGMRLSDYFVVHGRDEIPDGYLLMTFTVELMCGNEFYNGYTYLDVLSPEPTQRFIELTHEKYRKKMSGDFGGSIKGIFTDEPHRGPLLNGFGIANENALYMLPYTDKLFDEYGKRWGEKLELKLPELYFAVGDDNFSAVMWRYVEVLQELFLKNFAEPIHKWCKDNNLLLTGHVLHEDTLSAQTTMSGSVMRFYEHMSYPGMDNLGSDATCYPAAIAVSSAAKQTGKKFVLSELYGCTGWKTTFDEYKRIGDWHALLGINMRCPHLTWYTMRGEAKRDYPASIGKQASWSGEYRAVEDYFARLGKVLTECKPLTDTLVVTPVESAWGLTHLGTYYWSFATRDADYKKLEEEFARLTENLLYAGVDFDYGDEEMMSRLAKVGKDDKGAYIRVGKMTYRSAVLPHTVTVRATTLKLLRDFAALGGKVVLCGAPTHVDGVRTTVTVDGAKLCNTDEAAGIIGGNAFCRIESDGNILYKCKSAGRDEYVVFAVNADRQNAHTFTLSFDGEYNVEQFDLRIGETFPVHAGHSGGKTVVALDNFRRSEEILLHFTRKNVGECMEADGGEQCELPKIEAAYRLGSPNALVLDRAKCYIDGEEFCEDEVLRIDRRVRGKFGLPLRGGSMVQPWFKEKYGAQYAKPVCRLAMEFEFDADIVPPDAKLMTETYDSYSLTLNGEKICGKTEKSDIDECFTLVSVNDLIGKGRNVLRAECDFSDAFDLENFYIFGSFGVVASSPCRITALPEKLRLGDVTTQGLPFYSGDVTYMLTRDGGYEDGHYSIDGMQNGKDYYAACLKTAEGVSPFEEDLVTEAHDGVIELTATLTPKNLFGPLHEVPALCPVCGPDNFHTAGAGWSDGYSLLPQGIFNIPKLVKIN